MIDEGRREPFHRGGLASPLAPSGARGTIRRVGTLCRGGAGSRCRRVLVVVLLLLVVLPVLAVCAVVSQGAVCRARERSPLVACWKARDFLGRLGVDIVFVEEDCSPQRVRSIGPGTYEVDFRVRTLEPGTGAVRNTQASLTVYCASVDDWVLTRVHVGDDPGRACVIRSYPTGRAKRLWANQIGSWWSGRGT